MHYIKNRTISLDYLGIKNYRNVPKEDQVGALGLNDYIDELVNQTLHFIKWKLKDTGVCVINLDDVIINNQSQAIPQRVTLKMISGGVKFIQEVKWGKSNPNPLSNFKGFQPSTESILIFVKDEKKFIWNEYRNLNLEDQIILKQTINKTYVDSPNKRMVDVLNDELMNDFFKTSVFQKSEFKGIDPNYKHQAPQNEQIPLFFILFLFKILFLLTTPTANPAISNLPFSYVPGISAVSPPTNSQPDNLQPLRIPLIIDLSFFKSILLIEI